MSLLEHGVKGVGQRVRSITALYGHVRLTWAQKIWQFRRFYRH